jgi:hypothetical protein
MENMKTEMAMLPNGNYERVVSPIQHQCKHENYECIEYGWERGKLHLKLEDGDPYEDGYSSHIEIKFCPFCGYHSE